ncbi:MAG: hypothetical protein KA603_11805 [Azonexus sp.]|jgi:hypothetical protein|nr:hypothetical protein [Betaproteobacteria bacterium]MBK8918065.1 hypothetical protein [Betaproteobacteria bacterium]MBP6036810.1 hypothetical protein [Azonexus sp.]MBP6907293.1 hypothetical protein [Azonexus sp.]
MQIAQIQAAADPIQDRLLLRIATNTQEEVRVFVTRRLLRDLWPLLMAVLADHLGRPAPTSGSAPAGAFGEPYRLENPSLPLGAQPLLPGEAKVEPHGPGRCLLTLKEPRERCFALALDADLLHALCAMLRAGAEQARWDLDLPYGSPAPAGAEAAPKGKQFLH